MINRGTTLVSRLAMLFAVLFTLAGCGGGGGGGTFYDDDETVTPPATSTYTLALTLLDTAGEPTETLTRSTEGSIQIVLENDAGVPQTGKMITASTSVGTLDSTSGLTDSNGMLTLKLLAGTTIGSGTITAETPIDDETITGTLDFQVIAGDGALLELTLLGPDGQPTNSLPTGTLGTLLAKVTSSEDDAPVENEMVTVQTSIGSLNPSNGKFLTNESGVATFTVVAGTETGAGTLTATVEVDDTTLTSALNFQVTDGVVSSVAPLFLQLTMLDSKGQPTNSLAEGTTGRLQILVTRDSKTGPPAPGVKVTAQTQLGTLDASTGMTDSLGIVKLKFTAGTTLGVNSFTASTVITDETITGTLDTEITRKIRKLGYFDENDLFVENQILMTPDSKSTLAAGGTAGLTVVILDENDERITTPEEVIFTSGCVAAAQSTVSPPNPVSVNAEATTTYSAVSCSGMDHIAASIAGTDAQAFGTLNIAAPETNSINFISAEPERIVLRGTGGVGRDETSDLVFQVIDQSGRVLPGVRVDFSLAPQTGGLGLSNDYAISNAEGEVTVTVQAGYVATEVRVLATVDDGSGNPVKMPSDLLTVTTGIPDQDSISLSVDRFVIPNAAGENNVTTTLTVSMADRFNNPVPVGTAAVFTTEYGAIESRCTTNESGTCSVTWFSRPPKFPLLTEAEHVSTIHNTGCRYFSGNPRVPCPVDPSNPLDIRDTRGMRSTILVHAIGEESFVDAGNGVFDKAEAEPANGPPLFKNIPEAFLDNNEDGVYTRALQKCIDFPTTPQCIAGQEEEPVDFDGDGVYDLNDDPAIFNGLSCPPEGDGDWCSRSMLNVWDSAVITLSNNSASSWYTVMTLENEVVRRTTTGRVQKVYISDVYNNPPPAGATIDLSASDNCVLVGQTSFPVPILQYEGAHWVPVKTKSLDPAEGNPDFGTFTVTLNLEGTNPISWEYDCAFPPAPPPTPATP